MQIFVPYFKVTTSRRRNVCLYKECRHHTDRKKRDQGIGVLVASAFCFVVDQRKNDRGKKSDKVSAHTANRAEQKSRSG